MSKKTSKKPAVAYFCMEYGLSSDFKIYAGGLGILAGDYMKGAKDHGCPIVGVGIKWKQGYGDQMIDKDGRPFDAYHNYVYDFLKDTGVTVDVEIRGTTVKCKVWLVDCFGNAPLYLLDTDIPENADRWITGQLYGWFGEERIAQEMVLGIGGVRALRALGIDVDVYHFNEGHALFAGFELLREELKTLKKKKQKKPFKIALQRVREKVVFTTHTPVIQGNESHPIDRIMYMGANLDLSRKQLKKLGGEPFNMTVGALRMARKSNAVAQLHGETANKMWAHVKRRSEIVAITNGVHVPTWVDSAVLKAAKSRKKNALWDAHMANKKALVDFVKKRTRKQLDPEKLIIGFARRAVAYKRADLIFRKPVIIEPLLNSQKVQIIFSGKSHPLDDLGKELVANIVAMSKKYPKSVVFLENYDMTIGAALTRGADVWLNNPVRPKEASGTSGMKAAMNGVLNLSTLDGWWPEACQHGVNGWQFGDGFESDNQEEQDAHDLDALYKVLQEEVLPTFYDDKEKWQEMMKASINTTLEQFSVKRMLDEYYEMLYQG
ncbi:MAG: alpha-glucan family phosphorylase [Bacteroidetes bacterium]|nr:MAG: alpha-glucan family phosphorylase [Bacteroidota bacterium]